MQSAGEQLSYKWPKSTGMPCQWHLVSHALSKTGVLHDFMVQISFTNSVLVWQRRKQRAFYTNGRRVSSSMPQLCARGEKKDCLSVIPAARLPLYPSLGREGKVLPFPFTFCTHFTWSCLCSCLMDGEGQVSYWKAHVLESHFSACFYTFLEQKKIAEVKPSVFVWADVTWGKFLAELD